MYTYHIKKPEGFPLLKLRALLIIKQKKLYLILLKYSFFYLLLYYYFEVTDFAELVTFFRLKHIINQILDVCRLQLSY